MINHKRAVGKAKNHEKAEETGKINHGIATTKGGTIKRAERRWINHEGAEGKGDNHERTERRNNRERAFPWQQRWICVSKTMSGWEINYVVIEMFLDLCDVVLITALSVDFLDDVYLYVMSQRIPRWPRLGVVCLLVVGQLLQWDWGWLHTVFMTILEMEISS